MFSDGFVIVITQRPGTGGKTNNYRLCETFTEILKNIREGVTGATFRRTIKFLHDDEIP